MGLGLGLEVPEAHNFLCVDEVKLHITFYMCVFTWMKVLEV